MSKNSECAYRQENQEKRMEYALDRIKRLGLEILETTHTTITFLYKGNKIRHHAHTGWHSGKGIKDGRGIHKLLNQLTPCTPNSVSPPAAKAQ